MAHKHSVRDTGAHFLIDQFTRQIKNDSANKTTIVQYDHNSERLTFEIPLYVDGHAMTLCDLIEIHYINISTDGNSQKPGTYEVNDIKAEGENAVFTWLISQECTQLAGSLNFFIVFKCTEDCVTVYRWGTEIYKNLPISAGMDNGEAVLTEYPDILAQWKAQLFDASDTAVLNVATAEANALAAIEAAGEAKKQAVLDSIPDEYEALSAFADQNHRNKAGAIVLDAEGESIVVNDASEYPLQNLKLFGKSTQDGTPTPDAPVDIVSVENPTVSVCGKNLWDERTEMGYWQSANGEAYTADNQIRSKNFIPIVPEATIYVTAPNNKTIDFVFYDRNQSYISSRSIAQEVTAPPEAYYMHINLRADYGTTYNNDVCVSLIPLNGAYEPGNGVQTVETSYTLHGIPVSSGGNYTDASGKQWICDEVDLARGVYVQRVGVNNVSIDAAGALSSGLVYGTCVISDKIYANNIGLISTVAKCVRVSQAAENTCYENAMNIVFVGSDTDTKETLEEKFGGSTLLYTLATPIETPLSDAEISAFKALCTNKPNTTILNDAGAHMAVSYVADTKTYIDNAIAKITNA